MKKILALVLVLLMMSAVFVGCGTDADTNAKNDATADEAVASDFDYVKANGSMKIGYTVYDPMNYTDENGDFVGFDTDYAKAVCEKLGVEPEFVEIKCDTKEIELDAKNIDCIWNGFTITEERKQNVEFTTPYISNKQVVVIKADNKEIKEIVHNKRKVIKFKENMVKISFGNPVVSW